MARFAADLAEIGRVGGAIGTLATETGDLAVRLQGGCQAPPRVGDTQATAGYQRAHFDWTQTRFEDLVASERALAGLAGKLRESASTYAGQDDAVTGALAKILTDLDGRA